MAKHCKGGFEICLQRVPQANGEKGVKKNPSTQGFFFLISHLPELETPSTLFIA